MIDDDMRKGHMARPFNKPPFKNMFSPINLVEKAGSPDQFRLIYDLSYPYNSESINAYIPQEAASVQYVKLDAVIEMALWIGTEMVSCINVHSAFSNVPL